MRNDVCNWITERRNQEISASTIGIIEKAGPLVQILKMVRTQENFISCRNLSSHTVTRVSQITDRTIQIFNHAYYRRFMTSHNCPISNSKHPITVDETAIHLNHYPKRSIQSNSSKTVTVNIEISSSTRFTLAASVAIDGSKLPLFGIFKTKPGRKVEKSLPDIFPCKILNCFQRKACIDDQTMEVW